MQEASNTEQLISQFTDRYLTRDEIAYRLPVTLPISKFWPEMLARRKALATALESKRASVTVEDWKTKFGISTETARRDLLRLQDANVLKKTSEGKKAVFTLIK